MKKLLILAFCAFLIPFTGFAQKKKKKKKKVKPDVVIITEFGNILIDLSDETPGHRDNFLKLTEEGTYNGTLFHRIIDGFMVQGGDPYSADPEKKHLAGQGGPGYTQPAEFVDGMIHTRGAVAAARLGDGQNPEKESSGSQFYIVDGKKFNDAQLDQAETAVANGTGNPEFMYTDEQRAKYKEEGGAPWLDGQYTVFGYVVYGMDVVDKIAEQPKNRSDRPNEDIVMTVKKVKRWNHKKKKGKW